MRFEKPKNDFAFSRVSLNRKNILAILLICGGAFFLLNEMHILTFSDIGQFFGTIGSSIGRAGGDIGRFFGEMGGGIGSFFGQLGGDIGRFFGYHGTKLIALVIIVVGVMLLRRPRLSHGERAVIVRSRHNRLEEPELWESADELVADDFRQKRKV